ncbi:MAG: LysM peptidoglycan-binding domain-containing protein [Candidatus Bathyarchaeota archaeon]|nr:LysM peptidoglycan-binding domain-containing protein [Candidatus Termiticorpusculum sp.]
MSTYDEKINKQKTDKTNYDNYKILKVDKSQHPRLEHEEVRSNESQISHNFSEINIHKASEKPVIDVKNVPLQGKDLPKNATISQRNPYAGTPLSVSGDLSESIQNSFGIDTNKLSLRESLEVSKMGARATSQGNVIRFAPGEFSPSTHKGLSVLGHELTHVREQAMGGVHANVDGTNIHYDKGHESRSDKMGEAFANGMLSEATPINMGTLNAFNAPVQCQLTTPVTDETQTYTVVEGDTLWSISVKYYGNGKLYPTIFEANMDKIRDPNLIYPGQELIIPPKPAVNPSSSTVHRARVEKILPVPRYSQHSNEQLKVTDTDGTKLCWATCRAMISSYEFGTPNESREIARETMQNVTQSCLETAPNKEFAYSMFHSTPVNNVRPDGSNEISLAANTVRPLTSITQQEIKNNIDKNTPMVVRHADEKSGHFVVVVGYIEEGSRFVVVYNDPWDGLQHRKTLEAFQTDNVGRPVTHSYTYDK